MESYTPWIAILLTIISVISSILGYGILSSIAIISLFLLVSAFIFTFLIHQKKTLLGESEKDESFNHFSTQKQSKDDEEDSLVEEEEEKGVQETEPVEENKKRETKSQEHGVNQNHIQNTVGTANLHSESESIGNSCSSLSEDSDMDWLYSNNFEQSRECSDGSISDEESLFEIALPSGHFVHPKMQNKMQDFPSETIFYQPKLMELLAEINEINEEENMIEIDLTMGSIKCSRFEIEA